MTDPPKPEQAASAERRSNLLAAIEQRLREVFEKTLHDRIAQREVDTTTLVRFMESLDAESDRALIIIFFSYIDTLLTSCFTRELSPHIPPRTLLENFGPLASANARIKMACALSWISPDVYADLERLRKLRNHVAHSPFEANFSSARVASIVKSLSRRESVFDGSERLKTEEHITVKDLFRVRAMLTCYAMLLQLLTAPTALKMGMSPHTVWQLENWPDNLSALNRAMANWFSKHADVLWHPESPG